MLYVCMFWAQGYGPLFSYSLGPVGQLRGRWYRFFFDILTIIHFWKLKARIKKGQRKLCSVVSRLWILLKRTALGVVTSLGW